MRQVIESNKASSSTSNKSTNTNNNCNFSNNPSNSCPGKKEEEKRHEELRKHLMHKYDHDIICIAEPKIDHSIVSINMRIVYKTYIGVLRRLVKGTLFSNRCNTRASISSHYRD